MPKLARLARWTATILAAVLLPALAPAATLEVGTGKPYPLPSDAAAAAQDGDTVAIAPGLYYDCAIWHASRLTITGTGPNTTLTDRPCADKASFVIEGEAVTVRNLRFARIRVADGNGAGIRAEGRDLTVQDSSFENNQFGILAGGSSGFLRIAGCVFTANGVSLDGRPTHAVLAGALDLLRIENSTFERARGGDYIVSSARRTELHGNHLTDEGGRMSGPLVWTNGGALVLEGNTIDLAPAAATRPGAVLATGDASELVVRGNTLIAPDGTVPLLRNWTGIDATVDANTVPPNSAAVSNDGAAWYRLRSRLHVWAANVAAAKGQAAQVTRHLVAEMARRMGLLR